MEITQHKDLLDLLKALSDETRLSMIALMSAGEQTVSAMSRVYDLTEPTISHHVSKLHGAGFLNLRMEGTQRFYRVNPRRLAKFREYVAVMDVMPNAPEPRYADDRWIDALDWSAEDKKVLKDCMLDGRLLQLPMKQKKLLVVLRWLVTKFQADAHYNEKQVNAILTEVHEDYATLRRNLIEFGFMRREKGGGNYWVTPDEAPLLPAHDETDAEDDGSA